MDFEIFDLERIQSLYENTVKYNLTESGIHPFTLKEFLTEKETENLLNIRLGYGQTNGSVELREAICKHYKGADIDNILVTNGSAESNFTFTGSIIQPGDEVVIMLPVYMQIWGIARFLGANVKPFYLKEELDWAPDMDELRKAVTSKTRLICLCNPNNPTGAVLSRDMMEEIVNIADSVGAILHVDEIYRGSELQGEETPTFYGLYDKVIVTMSLSKSYSLPGLRMGWLIGPKDIIANCWAFHDYTSISTNMLSQYVASLIMQPDRRMDVLTRGRGMLKSNLAVFQKWIDSHSDLFHFIPPRAGGIVFVRYNMNINSTELSEKLRLEKSVFFLAGDCFGMDHYFRMGIGGEQKELIEGVELIDETLREIS